MTTYWHMQIHPTGQQEFAKDNIHKILEKHQFIGLGQWQEGEEQQIPDFKNKIKVNDIIAIKDGEKLIALVQVIGGAYFVGDDQDKVTGWIKNRRPIRVLDWEIDGKTLPQPRGTINRCVSHDAETTKIIKEWHERVNVVLKKRGLPLKV